MISRAQQDGLEHHSTCIGRRRCCDVHRFCLRVDGPRFVGRCRWYDVVSQGFTNHHNAKSTPPCSRSSCTFQIHPDGGGRTNCGRTWDGARRWKRTIEGHILRLRVGMIGKRSGTAPWPPMEGLVWDVPWVPARLECSRGGRGRSLARLSRADPQGRAEDLTWQFARRMHPRTSSPCAFVRPLVWLRSLPPRCICPSWGASAPPLPRGPRQTVATAHAWQANPGPAVPFASPRGDPIRSDPAWWSSLPPPFRMGSDGIHPTVHRSSPRRWCGPNAPSPPVRQTQGVHHQYGVEPTTMEATATKPKHIQGMTNVPSNDPWTSGDATERHTCEETHPKRGTSGRNHVDEWTEDVATKTDGNEGKERHHKTMHVGTAMEQCMGRL